MFDDKFRTPPKTQGLIGLLARIRDAEGLKDAVCGDIVELMSKDSPIPAGIIFWREGFRPK
ncbi:MAG: hypothetical protein ABSE82_00020 [Nitrososphaerales archaeon]|jgi:hypothetical protein